MDTPTLPVPAYLNLRAYRHAGALASELFWITRGFPTAEKDALTHQLRQTTRAVTSGIATSWKVRYSAAEFRARLSEAQCACSRLHYWIERAHAAGYLHEAEYRSLLDQRTTLDLLLARLRNQRISLLD